MPIKDNQGNAIPYPYPMGKNMNLTNLTQFDPKEMEGSSSCQSLERRHESYKMMIDAELMKTRAHLRKLERIQELLERNPEFEELLMVVFSVRNG